MWFVLPFLVLCELNQETVELKKNYVHFDVFLPFSNKRRRELCRSTVLHFLYFMINFIFIIRTQKQDLISRNGYWNKRTEDRP